MITTLNHGRNKDGTNNTTRIPNSDKNIFRHDIKDHTLVTSLLKAIGVELPKVVSISDEALVYEFEPTLIFLEKLFGNKSSYNNKRKISLIEAEIEASKVKIEEAKKDFLRNIDIRTCIAHLSKILFLMIILDKNIDVGIWKNVVDKFFDTKENESNILSNFGKVTFESTVTSDFFSPQELEKYKPLVDELNSLLKII